ncbi:MAG: hypothetical protein J6T10_15030 [Methanobrevibacter sp.]|nr:hypothetical protein [Methanobrevibacter sp.]
MIELLENIHDFITDPKMADDDAFVGTLIGMFIACIISMAIIYNLNESYLGLPGWVLGASCGLAFCCAIVWYYIDDDYVKLHYFYAFLVVLFSGTIILILPICLLFVIITLPVWIIEFGGCFSYSIKKRFKKFLQELK